MIEEEEGYQMPLISIATLMITVAFAFVCIYIAGLIFQVTGLLKTVGQTFDQVEHQLDQTIVETEQLIGTIEQSATDVEEKLHATSAVFKSLENVGQASSIMSETLKEKVTDFSSAENLHATKPFIRIIQWSEYSSVLLESWKRGKKVAFEAKQSEG